MQKKKKDRSVHAGACVRIAWTVARLSFCFKLLGRSSGNSRMERAGTRQQKAHDAMMLQVKPGRQESAGAVPVHVCLPWPREVDRSAG